MDHQIKWYPKWERVGLVAGIGCGPREVIMEALKGKIVCKYCHYHGSEDDIGDYYQRLQMPNALKYSRDIYGDKHRTVNEVLDIKEVASLRLDLEQRNAFAVPKRGNGTITYQTVQVVLWNHLRIYLPDLRRGDETACIEFAGRNHKLCMRMFRELFKMLGVKCPGSEECFLNLREPTRSGVDFNHMQPSKKLMKPTDVFDLTYLTRAVEESKVGMLHPIDAGSHEEVTAFQRKHAGKPAWYSGN